MCLMDEMMNEDKIRWMMMIDTRFHSSGSILGEEVCLAGTDQVERFWVFGLSTPMWKMEN